VNEFRHVLAHDVQGQQRPSHSGGRWVDIQDVDTADRPEARAENPVENLVDIPVDVLSTDVENADE